MPIIVGFTTKPEGQAALRHAVLEARAHEDSLLVVHIGSAAHHDTESALEDDLAAARRMLTAAGVEHEVRQLATREEPAGVIVDLAKELDASMIVIGMRRRSPVGKLLLGGSIQQIMLDASCPVVAVKAS